MVGHQITCVQACVARQTFQMAGQVSNRRYLGIAEQLPQQALMAVHPQMNPAASDVLYFVARGDGSSVFSRTLDEHNQAVNRYQKGGKR